MPIPEFIVDLRRHVGHAELWLIGVTAIVLRGDPAAPDDPARRQVLLVRRSDNGQWTPVTGIVDPGETPAAAAPREVLEETRVTARIERLVWVNAYGPVTHVNGDRARYLDHTLLCSWVSGEPQVGDDESTDTGWFALDDLPPMHEVFRGRLATALTQPAEAGCHLGPDPLPGPAGVNWRAAEAAPDAPERVV